MSFRPNKKALPAIAVILFALAMPAFSADARPADRTDTLTMTLIGDVMMHSAQLSDDHHCFLKHIAPLLRSADIAVANMEFSLGGKPYSGYPTFSAPDYMASYVCGECGVDVALLANNHILDRGRKGLERTLGVYRAMSDSLLFTGAAADSLEMDGTFPLVLWAKGMTVALVNFTYGTNGISVKGWPNVSYMDENKVRDAFARARDCGADFIVALPHWGEEYQLRHSAKQSQWAEKMVGWGASAIVGSHPHVVQDTTHIAGVPVIYSMGNAVSHMSAVNTRLALAVTLRFCRNAAGPYMLEPELRFIWCTLPGNLEPSHSTIFVDEWEGRRDAWKNPGDYDNMAATLARVKKATGIE